MGPRKLYLVFFVGLALLYLSMSPGEVWNMGYTSENIRASNEILSNLGNWLTFRIADRSITWPRHGLLELIFEMPFLLLDKLFASPTREWNDRFLALAPIITTSLLCTLVFIWVHRITSSLVWAYLLAMVAGFATMLWPYAFIGLETTHSLFLMLAAYMAIGAPVTRSWRRAFAFAFSCGMAISLKTNSVFLIPAIAYLVYVYFQAGFSSEGVEPRRKWKQIIGTVATIAILYFLNDYTRSLAGLWREGMVKLFFNGLATDGPLSFLMGLFSLFGSPNKGLLIYCPVIIICFAVLHRVYKTKPQIVIFVVLATAGMMGGCSLFYYWADETWGPRYLCPCIAPLIVCFAVARASVRFRVRREIPLIALTLWGIAVSFLGAFFYYGSLHLAATQSIHPTIEAFQYEPEWNHIRFNAKLLQQWMHGSRPREEAAEWPPARHRWYPGSGESPIALPERTIKLQDYANPQPLLLRNWPTVRSASLEPFWYVCLNCLWLGPVLLIWLARLISKADGHSHVSCASNAAE